MDPQSSFGILSQNLLWGGFNHSFAHEEARDLTLKVLLSKRLFKFNRRKAVLKGFWAQFKRVGSPPIPLDTNFFKRVDTKIQGMLALIWGLIYCHLVKSP